MTDSATRSRLGVTFVLAVALAVVWALLCVWTSSLATSLMGQGRQAYEQVTVANDGTPLIVKREGFNWEQTSYRTLAGEPVELEQETGLNPARLSTRRRPPGLFEYPMPWSSRVLASPSYSNPNRGWYLVRDADRPGRAVYEVFDNGARRRVGFFGRRGMRESLPDVEEWFEVGQPDFSWAEKRTVASTGYLQPGSYIWGGGFATEDGPVPGWLHFLKDGDVVVEVDTRSEQLRTLIAEPGVLSLATLSEPLPKSPVADGGRGAGGDGVGGDGVGGDGDAPGLSPPAGAVRVRPVQFDVIAGLAPPTVDAKRKTRRRLAVRSEDRVVLVDPKTDSRQDFLLPPWAREVDFTAYSLGDDRLLLQVARGYWSGGDRVDLVWIDPAGETAREETLELAGFVPGSAARSAWMAAPVAPAPIGWLAAWGGFYPTALLQTHKAAGFGEAFWRSTLDLGPAGLVVILVGVVGAVFAWNRHRKWYRHDAGWWVGLVAIMGPAGLAAYLIYWGKPPVTSCAECGRVVPRDREDCPACGAEWPTPAMTGVEVFG